MGWWQISSQWSSLVKPLCDKAWELPELMSYLMHFRISKNLCEIIAHIFRNDFMINTLINVEIFLSNSNSTFSKSFQVSWNSRNHVLLHASKLKITAKQEVTCFTILDTLPIFVAFHTISFWMKSSLEYLPYWPLI